MSNIKQPGGYIRTRYNKKGDITYYQVCVLVGYTENNGKRRPQYKFFKAFNKEDAEELLLQKQAEFVLNKKKVMQASSMTMKKFIEEEYLPNFVFGILKDSSAKCYEEHSRYVVASIGSVKLKDLTTVMLQRMYKNMFEASPLSGNSLSYRTVLDIKRFVSTALNTAISLGYLSENPNYAVKLRRPEHEKVKDKKVYTREEMAMIFHHVKGTPAELIILLAYDSGMRRGELCGLQFSDFNFEENYVDILRNITEGKEAQGRINYAITTTPKTKAGRRRVYLSKTTMELVKKELVNYKKQKMLLGEKFIDSDRLFRDARTSKPLQPHSIYQIYRRSVKELPITSLKFHALRATSITHALEAGASVKAIAEKVGHRDVLVTQNIYEACTTTMKHQAADIMENIITNVVNM